MKIKHSETTSDTNQPTFAKVAECLYRTGSSGIYYALVKRHGKQFRRSLKTSDRQLAKRRLADFREKATQLYEQKCFALFDHIYKSYPERDVRVYASAN